MYEKTFFVGTSVSLCIQDIIDGKRSENEVLLIIAGTKCDTEEQWQKVKDNYSETFWARNPQEACAILDRLRAKGKIYQPRLIDNVTPFTSTTWVGVPNMFYFEN